MILRLRCTNPFHSIHMYYYFLKKNTHTLSFQVEIGLTELLFQEPTHTRNYHDGRVVESVEDVGVILTWLDTHVLSAFVDPVCGDGACTSPGACNPSLKYFL